MWLLSSVIIKSSNWKPPLNLVICEIWGVEVHLDICLSSDENDNFVCEEKLSCTRNRKSSTFLKVSRSRKKISSRDFSQKTNGRICFSILTVRKYLKLKIEIQPFKKPGFLTLLTIRSVLSQQVMSSLAWVMDVIGVGRSCLVIISSGGWSLSKGGFFGHLLVGDDDGKE